MTPPLGTRPLALPDGPGRLVQILPGQFHVSGGDERILTLLGSCVAACIRDVRLRAGGMNHFLLPEPAEKDRPAGWDDDPTRYGCFAMEQLINGILARGGRRERLEVKLFGGGRMIAGMSDVGARNIEFVKRYLAAEGLRCVAEDLGGDRPRKVLYDPSSGLAMVRKLGRPLAAGIALREQGHATTLAAQPVAGEVDLWG